jgi:transposase
MTLTQITLTISLGTADHRTGYIAGDAVNRGLSYEEANPYRNMKNVVYTINDDVRLVSTHDKKCLLGADPKLTLRYSTDWLAEGEDILNPYLLYLRLEPYLCLLPNL